MDQERTQTQSRPTIVSYSKTRVSVIDGPDRGLSCETAGRPIRVGTAPDNDLVLSDPTVSRCHCAITPTPEGFRVSDEGSTNGVRVGRVQIFEAVLIGSSDLRIGETTVSVVALPDRVEREQFAEETLDLSRENAGSPRPKGSEVPGPWEACFARLRGSA